MVSHLGQINKEADTVTVGVFATQEHSAEPARPCLSLFTPDV